MSRSSSTFVRFTLCGHTHPAWQGSKTERQLKNDAADGRPCPRCRRDMHDRQRTDKVRLQGRAR